MLLAIAEELTTPLVIIGGVLASLFTAATTAYSAFRSAKYDADLRESELVHKELQRANKRIEELEQWVEYWKGVVAAKGGS